MSATEDRIPLARDINMEDPETAIELYRRLTELKKQVRELPDTLPPARGLAQVGRQGYMSASDKALIDNAFGSKGWTNFTFNAYFDPFPTFGVPQWRREGNRVYTRGLVRCIAATGTPWGMGMTSPAPVVQRVLTNGGQNASGTYVIRDLRIDTSGNWGLYSTAMVVNDWITLDGLFYEVA